MLRVTGLSTNPRARYPQGYDGKTVVIAASFKIRTVIDYTPLVNAALKKSRRADGPNGPQV